MPHTAANLADRVQGTRTVGKTREVQFARLTKEFEGNEALLTKTFSPEEMNTIFAKPKTQQAGR